VTAGPVKYSLRVDKETIPLEISKAEGGNLAEVWAGEASHLVAYKAVSETHLHLVVDGRAVEAFVAKAENGKHIFFEGQTFLVLDADRMVSSMNHPVGDDTPGDITPPMPSVVLRIFVAEGDPVERGQGLVVVTAMKMETTLVAPYKGRVRKINTRIEARVAPGETLVEIEREVPTDG
jgi:biotin carboxyl carrier protein